MSVSEVFGVPCGPFPSSVPSAVTRAWAETPEVTVVIPTLNESANIAPLLDRLLSVSRAIPLAVLFVDDSTDATPHVISDEARRRAMLPVRLIHRAGQERAGGLGTAVLLALRSVQSPWACVMDADLQHPPELLGALLAEASSSRADLVVASRYCPGGDVGEFSTLRTALSRGAVLLARTLFPRRLRRVTDPLSGYFLIRPSAIDLEALRPRGFKILLEILIGADHITAREVAFRFGERYAGASKASLREAGRYVYRLAQLWTGQRRAIPARIAEASGRLVRPDYLTPTRALPLASRRGGSDHAVSAMWHADR